MKYFIAFILSIFLVAGPYLQIPGISLYDSKRIIQLVILSIVGLSLFVYVVYSFWFKKNRYKKDLLGLFENQKIKWSLGVFLSAGLVSTILSSYPSYALLEVVFLMLIVCLIYMVSPSNLKEHYSLGKIIFLTALIYPSIYIIVFIGNYISSFYDPMMILWPNRYDFTIIYEGMEFQGKEVLYFDNIRFFNHTQTWSLPFLIGFMSFIQKKNYPYSYSILFVLLTGFWWMLIFASGGRGTLVGVLSGILILTIFYKKDVFAFIKNGILTLLVGILSYYLIFIHFTETVGRTVLRTGNKGRFEVWRQSLDLWSQNPIFGIGPMHFAEIRAEPFYAHSHNFYLQILSEWGIIAFIAFLILIIIAVRFIYTQKNKIRSGFQNEIIYVTFTWSILAVSIHAFFSGIMHTPLSQIWFVLVGAWFFGYKKRSLADINLFHRNDVQYYLYLFFLILVLYLTYDYLFNLNELYELYENTYKVNGYYPRFWRQGLFPIDQ